MGIPDRFKTSFTDLFPSQCKKNPGSLFLGWDLPAKPAKKPSNTVSHPLKGKGIKA